MQTSVNRRLDITMIMWALFGFFTLILGVLVGAVQEPLFWWLWSPGMLLGGAALYLRTLLR